MYSHSTERNLSTVKTFPLSPIFVSEIAKGGGILYNELHCTVSPGLEMGGLSQIRPGAVWMEKPLVRGAYQLRGGTPISSLFSVVHRGVHKESHISQILR